MRGTPGTCGPEPLADAFEMERIVEWGDCDAAGIAFYPAFFRWMDAAFHLMTEADGWRQAALMRTAGRGDEWREVYDRIEALRLAGNAADLAGHAAVLAALVLAWRDADGRVPLETPAAPADR